MYFNAVKNSGILEDTHWMDIRGNHDTFNVASFDEDFYRNFSVQGPSHQRSYSHQTGDVNGDRYTFLAVDASLIPGPKRPFNFIGQLSKDDMQSLNQLVADAKGNQSEYLIWFSHYPTSCIMSDGPEDIRSLIGKQPESLVYLCGHLHTFMGLAPRMLALQNTGFMEIELGDWMRSRMYRVAAVDHGLFSFVDVKYNQFPIVLITNPKDATLHIPGREDMGVSLQSSHIRILAYSSAPIIECRVRIDNAKSFQSCVESEAAKNLFTAPWAPEKYAQGVHSIEVVVTDGQGRSATRTQKFSLDNSEVKREFSAIAGFLLSVDFHISFIVSFVIAFSVCILPMVVFRLWHRTVYSRGAQGPRIRWIGLRNVVRKFWLLCSVDRLFYPIILFYVYILVGPWMVGEVIDGHTGWVFLWGIFVKGHFFPGTLSYAYGFTQIMLGQLPMLIVFSDMVDYKFRKEFSGRLREVVGKEKSRWERFAPHLPFTVMISVEIILAIIYLIFYGPMSFILGPLRVWSVVLHLILFHQAYTLKEESLKEGIVVWSNEQKPE